MLKYLHFVRPLLRRFSSYATEIERFGLHFGLLRRSECAMLEVRQFQHGPVYMTGDDNKLKGQLDKMEGALRAAVRQILSDLPESYPDRYTFLRSARKVFQAELAASLQPSLNAYLVKKRDTDYEERRRTADLVNSDLWMLGLACRAAHGRNPAFLTLRHQDAHKMPCPIYLSGYEGYPRTRAGVSDHWPPLELIDNPPRYPHQGRWFKDDDSERSR